MPSVFPRSETTVTFMPKLASAGVSSPCDMNPSELQKVAHTLSWVGRSRSSLC